MSVHVNLFDFTEGADPALLGRCAEELMRGLPELPSVSVANRTEPNGEPIGYESLASALGYLDADAPREEWIRFIAGIRAAPIPDDPDESKRRDLAHRFSVGELDHAGRFNTEPPPRYTSPEDVDQAFDTLPPKDGGVGVGTILRAAMAEGWKGSNRRSARDLFAHFALQEHVKPIPFRDVLARQVAPVQEIIPGYVERGIPTFLCGPGGSCKSRLALQWGLCVASASKVFGRDVAQATLVFLSSEDHANEVARRAQAISRRLHLPTEPNGFFWDRVGQDSALASMQEGGDYELRPFYSELKSYLNSIAGHKLVIVDSCYDYVRFAGKAKIDEGAVNTFVKNVLQRLCDETDATLIVIWHPSQSGLERDDSGGWSVAWVNAPRARIAIVPVRDTDDAFELSVKKRNHAAKGKPITLRWSEGALLPRAETDATEQEGALIRAVARVAIMAAEQGLPIQQKGRLVKWQLDEIERETGRRPTDREAKEALTTALPRGLLRYVRTSRHRAAGYYPPDEEKAAAFAVAAKRKTASSDADE